MLGVDAGGRQQFGRRAGARQLGHAQVRQAELLTPAQQRVHNSRAKAAFGMVVLGDDEPAAGGTAASKVSVSIGFIEYRSMTRAWIPSWQVDRPQAGKRAA